MIPNLKVWRSFGSILAPKLANEFPWFKSGREKIYERKQTQKPNNNNQKMNILFIMSTYKLEMHNLSTWSSERKDKELMKGVFCVSLKAINTCIHGKHDV